MRRQFTILLFLLFLAINLSAQLRTYLVPELGPSWDISRVKDPGNMFKQSLLAGSNAGFSIWQEVIENFSIGTGVYYHNYSSGLNPLDQRNHQVSLPSYTALLIPARVAYRIHNLEFPISLQLRLGYQYGLVLNDPILQNSSSILTDNEGLTMSYNLVESNTGINTLQLIEAGITLEYNMQNNWLLSMNISHFSGLNEVKSAIVDYQNSAAENQQATYSNDGSSFQTTFGLNIPLSNLWEKRDVRLHRKIESAYGKNRSMRNIRYLYFGGDIGALWRSFSSSNPAVGPRPLNGKGIFRYSNLYTGAYVGYNFNGYYGIDIGAYYQRSNNFYSVMYDHEDDFVSKVAAPFYLDIPIMFKYFYDLQDIKLSFVPSFGVSVLTHFAGVGTAYGNDDGTFNYSTLSGTSDANVSSSGSRLANFGFLVHAGLGIEYDIPVNLPLTATFKVAYSHGLRNIDQLEIDTSIPEVPLTSTITSNGNGWKAMLGIRYPILLGKDNRKCGAMPRIR